QMFTVGDPNPRAWQVIGIPDASTIDPNHPTYKAFGDIQVSGANLYYTREDIVAPGGFGVVGTATLYSSHIGSPGDYTDATPTPIPHLLPLTDENAVASLGRVYTSPGGAYVAGDWQVRGAQLALQRVQIVDTKAGIVTSQLCVLPSSARNDP